MYKNTIVSIVASYLLVKRISELFDQVTMKLPDEEQFRMSGVILIGSRKIMTSYYKKITNPTFGLGSSINLHTQDGNGTFFLCEDLKDSVYLITLMTEDLNAKSDDSVKGSISYKISEWSYVWKKAREAWHEPGELGEHSIILHQKMPPIVSEEYERNVNKEVERLGFGKELLAYDIQS